MAHNIPLWVRFAISIVYDGLDFFIGRIPIFGIFYDIFGGFLALWFWGGIGGIQFLEVIDITEQFDAFIPTMTIAGIISVWRGR